jgi:hypothetical protein
MSQIVADVEADLHARLMQWAQEQQRPLPALVRDILCAAERVRGHYDPTMSPSTRAIRRCRDGGCGLCDQIEPLFARDRAPVS